MTRDEWIIQRQRIADLIDIVATAKLGCGSHNCKIYRPTGLGTNSGCRCYLNLIDPALELALLCDQIKHIVSIPQDDSSTIPTGSRSGDH